jgi:hypothetical protein
MTTGINGQKTCILRTDEKYDANWHHWAGKGLTPYTRIYHHLPPKCSGVCCTIFRQTIALFSQELNAVCNVVKNVLS